MPYICVINICAQSLSLCLVYEVNQNIFPLANMGTNPDSYELRFDTYPFPYVKFCEYVTTCTAHHSCQFTQEP
jgi:hypothetical protein